MHYVVYSLYSALRLELATSNVQIVKEIIGVRGSTSTDTRTNFLKLGRAWLLHAANFWNSLGGKLGLLAPSCNNGSI